MLASFKELDALGLFDTRPSPLPPRVLLLAPPDRKIVAIGPAPTDIESAGDGLRAFELGRH